jgi:hypothetical protein
VVADTPVFISGSYASSGVVTAAWQFAGGTVDFILAVFQGQPQGTSWIAHSSVTGFIGNVTAPSGLNPSYAYTVAVAVDQGGGTPGPWSAPMSLVFQKVTSILVSNSGKDVTVGWTVPYPSSIAAVAVALADQTTGNTVASGTYDGTEATLVPKPPLSATDTYTLTLTGVNGNFSGPPTSGPAPIVATPTLSSVTYAIASATSAKVTGVGQIVNPAPAPTVVMTLFENGVPTQQQVGQGFIAQLNLAAPLSPWSRFTVGLFYQDGQNSGPIGNRGNVLQTPPLVQSTAFDGTNVTVAWVFLAGDPAPTGAQASLYDETANTKAGSGFNDGLSVTFAPSDPLSPTGNYGVTLSPLQGQSQGPEGPAAPVIIATKAITSVAYDGAQISVTWSNALGPNVAGYLLHLLSGTQSIRRASAGLASGSIDVTLDQSGQYQVAVQAIGSIATGPVGTAVTVITQSPTVGSIVLSAPNNAPQVSAQITAPAGVPNGTTYVAYLYEGGLQVAGPVTASGLPLSVTFATDVFGKAGYTIRAAAQATVNGAQVTGPLGPAAPVLGAAPRIVAASIDTDPSDSDNWRFTVAWDLPDAAPGAIATSVVTVTQGGTAVASSGDVTGSAAQFSATKASVDATKPGVVTVASKGPFGASPSSAAVNAVFTAPALQAAAYDGGEIASTWAWTTANSAVAAVATGYRILFYDLGASPPALIYVSAPTASLGSGISRRDAALGSLANVGIGIEVDAGLSQFRGGAATALILDRPALTSSAVSGTTLTLRWTAPTMPTGVAISGYLARLRVGGGAPLTTSISGAVTTASIDLTKITGLKDDPLRPASVTLAAQAQSVTGPESTGLVLLRHAATQTVAAVTGTVVAAQWAPAPGPVDSYEAVITKDGSSAATAYSPTTTVAIPVGSPTVGSTYALTVVPNIGDAAGPASTGLNLVLIAPAVSGAVFDGKTVTVSVTAPNVGSATLTGYRMLLSVNGRIAQTSDVATGSTISMPVDNPVDAAAAFAVGAMALAGGAAGPVSAMTAMIPNAPTITAVACTGTSLVMTLDPSSIAIGGATLQGYLYTDGIAGSPVAASNNQVTFTVAANHSYQVASQAINGATKGPQSQPIAALTAAPTLSAAAYRNGALALAWSGTDRAGTYLVTVANGATNVVQSTVTGLSATPALNADPTVDYTVSVQQAAGIVTGPAMTPTAIATSGCTITAITFTDASTASIVWSAPPSQAANVTQYQIVALVDGAEQVLKTVSSPATTTTVSTGSLLAGLSYAFAVRAVIANATGPIGAPFPLFAAVPAGLVAHYDGHNIVAQWAAVADPRVTGYRATISITGQNDIPVDATGISFSYPYDISSLAAAAAITVKVAGRAGASIGPNTGMANVRTGNPAFYVGDLANAVAPAVYPCLTVPPGAADLVFYLPELFATHQTNPITQGPFTLTPMSPVVAPYAYTVTTASSSSLWSFSDLSARQTIAAQFASFLAAIAGTTGALPQAARIVQQTLGAGLPLTFSESLLYRYSFDPDMRFVDLQAGMRLEIRYESYQYVTGNSAGIDGYVTSGVAVHEISDLPEGTGLNFTAIDPFLGSLQAISFAAPQQGGAGGVIDLQTAAYRRPFLRLFYPASFPAGQSTGSTDANHAVAIVAAATWSALDRVTQNFIQFGTLPPPSADASINYFRGRAVPVPQVVVSVNGAGHFVPLGTTLGGILASHGLMPDLTGVAVSGLALLRPITPSLPPAEIATGINLANKRPVMVGYQNLAALSDGTTVFDLPLVQGDEVWTGRLAGEAAP